jgi:hypothetical protein
MVCIKINMWQFYRVFHRFGQGKFAYGGWNLGSSQFTLLPQLPLRMMLSLKFVKIDWKISNSLRWSKSVTHSVFVGLMREKEREIKWKKVKPVCNCCRYVKICIFTVIKNKWKFDYWTFISSILIKHDLSVPAF